jgi:type VI secretion system VasD/TssJ family lipoprotein
MKRAAVLAIMLIAGCGSDTVRLRGVRPMNLNEAGESTPVNVRIYPLKDDKRFTESEFEDLWVRDKDVLQDDWVSVPTVTTVLPGDEKDPPQEIDLGNLPSEVKYVGVMALYGKRWPGQKPRRVVHVQNLRSGVFELRGYGVSIDVEKEYLVLDPATPLEIRIYQLENDRVFLGADLPDLVLKDKEILEEDQRGNAVIVKTTPVDDRGRSPAFEVSDLHATAKYLGVFARFEHRGGEEYRRVVIRLSDRPEYLFELCGYRFQVNVKKTGD